MGFEGRGQTRPYIWQDFNGICDLEKFLRLRKTLHVYCFSFAVCLSSYITLLDYGSTDWLILECDWVERKGLTAGRTSIVSEIWRKCLS